MADGTIDLLLPTENDGYQPILTASIDAGSVVLCTIDGSNRIEHSISAKAFQVWASTVLAEISLVEDDSSQHPPKGIA